MKIFSDELHERLSVGRRGFRRGFGSVMGFLTNQFDERIIEKFLDRGDIKYLLLNSLGKKPMHGYELISDIESDFQGLYAPSPGAVYPTLQMLEEAELVKGDERDGKKVYSLTVKGEAELRENSERIKEILSRVSEHRHAHWFGSAMRNLSNSYTGLGADVFIGAKRNYHNGDANVELKLKKIQKILDDARKSVSDAWLS